MTIEIDGKELEVLGTEPKAESFGIHTSGGTYWMKPCKPKPGQDAFWMGKNGFAVELPPECPQRISRITFDEPDLTDQFPDEVEADYQAYKKHCKETGEKILSVEQYKKAVAVFDIWRQHKTPELALQHGYIEDDFLIYYSNLEGQKIAPDCLHKFKWAAEYMDEDGRGTFILFECLAVDPLPKEYKKSPHEAKVSGERAKAARKNKKVTPEQEKKIAGYYWKLRSPKDQTKTPQSKNNAGILTAEWIRRLPENGGLGLSSVKYSSKSIQRIAGD